MAGAHRAKRSLGQNFLIDPNLRLKIVDAVGAGPHDPVLEIGPGRGALTEHLAERSGDLVAVELDDALAAALAARWAGRAGVTVVHGDVLGVDLRALTTAWGATRVVGNIPYNITTPILFRLLEPPRPLDIVLMVQAEVADRIVASPGTSAYGALAVGVQTVARAERLFRVGRRAFRPVPRVDSAVVRVTPLSPPPRAAAAERALRRVVRAAFQWRRKQMGTILRGHPELRVAADALPGLAEAVGFDLRARPETLSPERFVALADALQGDPPGR